MIATVLPLQMRGNYRSKTTLFWRPEKLQLNVHDRLRARQTEHCRDILSALKSARSQWSELRELDPTIRYAGDRFIGSQQIGRFVQDNAKFALELAGIDLDILPGRKVALCPTMASKLEESELFDNISSALRAAFIRQSRLAWIYDTSPWKAVVPQSAFPGLFSYLA